MASTIVGAMEPSLQNLVKESRILLIGTGGIGCEVLKNLVLMGFSEVEIIDLDTIEVSNLNRQFLFHKESVGKPKSLVARESVLEFNPNVNIKAHFGDIMDQKYGVAFYNKFKLVINALDNRMARIHVNRMCLSCSIPLIESGTTGYSGQVELILKGQTMCYECLPKATPKTYPMCTIRNTPKAPIHCIVWAKFLFDELFGESEESVSLDQILDSNQGSSSSAEEFTNMPTREWAMLNDYNREKLLKKIFFDDIYFMIHRMPHLYKEKSVKPVQLNESLLNQRSDYKEVSDTEVLDLPQNVTMFLDSIDSINEKRKNSNKPLVWDKDEDDFMNFVVSCTNIRSATFNIKLLSHFEIKSMAGNIIPAIATANAAIAGQIVMHVLRILKEKVANCQSVFLRGIPNHRGGMLVKDRKLQVPVPTCNVCSTQGKVYFTTDINKMTVRQFQDLVLKQKLNVVAPDVIVDGRIIISSDEEDDLDMNHFLFSDLQIKDGSIFSIDDFFQSYTIKLQLIQKDQENEEDPLFEIYDTENDYLKAKNGQEQQQENDDCIIEEKNSQNNINDDSISMIADEGWSNELNKEASKEGEELSLQPSTSIDKDEIVGFKRKNEDPEDETTELKKIRTDTTTEDEVLTSKRKADDDVDFSEPKKSHVD